MAFLVGRLRPPRMVMTGPRGPTALRARLVVCAFAAACTIAGVQATAAHARAKCPTVILIGARGSGESIDKSKQGDFKGLGPEVYRMAKEMKARLAKSKLSLATRPDTYEADSTDDLIPSASELATITSGWVPALLTVYQRSKRVRRFLRSIKNGAALAIDQIRRNAKRCPRSSLVLAGYSQGAMAMHQAELELRDAGETELLTHVAGALLLADGDRVASTTAKRFGTASSTAEGIRTYLRRITPRDVVDPANTADICAARDIVCDFNLMRVLKYKSAVKVHESYRGKDARLLDKAAAWLAKRIIRARSGPSTSKQIYSPFVDGELRPGLSISDEYASAPGAGLDGGGCTISDVTAAYRCFTDNNFIFDPCYEDPTSVSVVCVRSPWATTAARVDVGGLPSLAGIKHYPWALELQDGSKCVAVQGARGSVDGKVIRFNCGGDQTFGPLVIGDIDRSRAAWNATVVRDESGAGRKRVGVTTAWL